MLIKTANIIVVKNFHKCLTTVVKIQKNTCRTADTTATIFDRKRR